MSLKHICNYPGCSRLANIGTPYCPVHHSCSRQREYDRTVRLTRDAKYHAFYVSPEWEQMKRFIHSRYKGLCLWSYYHNTMVQAAEVHHIEPLREAWEKRLLVSNLIPLSHEVHMWVESEYRKGNKTAVQRELFALLERWTREFGPGGM